MEENKSSDSIQVLVRVRPLSEKELSDSTDTVVDIQDNQNLKVTSFDGKKSFQCSFDSVVGPETNQAQVYDIVRGCTQSVLDGFNSTIFAYGQTGSGKVTHFHTIIGIFLPFHSPLFGDFLRRIPCTDRPATPPLALRPPPSPVRLSSWV